MPQPRFSVPALFVAAAAASFALGVSTAQAQPTGEFVPVTDAMLQDPDPADWPMWRRTLDGWGYSPLDQVNRDNVGELQMAWSRALPQGTQEVTPLAYGGVVYMPTVTDIIQALDATNGDLIWEYRRDLPDDVYEFVGGNARSMRNIAIYDRQIINISDDDYAYALDVETGDVVWETQIFDYQETPAGHSSGPIIADGRVISGRSCRPRGGPESCDAPGPRPRRLAHVAPHPTGGATRPGEPTTGELQMAWSRAAAAPGGHAPGLRRRRVPPARPSTRPTATSSGAACPTTSTSSSAQRPQHAEHRHLRPADHQHQRRRLRPSTSRPATSSGRPIFDYQETPAGHSSGPIIADGPGHELPPPRRARVVRPRRPRRPHRRGAVAAAHGAGPRRARRRDLGRRALRAAGARRLVDTGQLRPRAPADLPGHVGHLAGPQVHARRVENTHLYHNSTLALDVETGEIRWYYQHLNDHWDLDHPFERLLVDTAVAPDPDAVSWINPRIRPGEVRRVVTGIPGKTGVVYTLDRETGEFLWATPTVSQNVINDIDGATGAVTENAEVTFTALGQEVLACPTWAGGKDWEAGAYSPLTNTMYMPLRNTCARMLATDDVRSERARALTAGGQGGLEIYALAARHQITPGEDDLGTVYAVSAETGRTVWLHEQRAATMSVMATGGGLVFGGDVNGRFRALDQETGAVLWEINLGSPVVGFPITYAVDGRQYVAVNTGAGGGINLRMTPELRPSVGSVLFVFALP